MKLHIAIFIGLISFTGTQLSAETFTETQLSAETVSPVFSFGDDSGPLANDHECDDPRFVGWGVATSTSEENMGRDATDCLRLFQLGQIRLNRAQEETSPAECEAVNFGDDSSQWANDGECDDPRFIGGGAHTILNFEDIGRDATDCRSLCESGAVWLR